MYNNNRVRAGVLLGEVIIAALLSAGLAMITVQSAGLPVDASLIYLSAAVAAGALFGLSYSRASGWITLMMIVLAALIAVFFGWRPVADFKEFMDQVYTGGSLIVYSDAFAVLSLILMMAAFYIIAHQRVGAYLMLFITVALMGILWFFGEVSTSIHILPVLLALSAMFSKTGRFRFSALRPLLSLSLAAAILACALVPAKGVKVDALNEYAQKALAFMIRTFNIDNKNLEERRSFTIVSNGWASHKELIGGNAYPTQGEVMSVEGEPGEVYLRGAIRYVYNNNAWVDESNESKAGKIKRYMFSGFEKLIYKSEFERAMDHDKKASEKYFEEAVIDVEILSDNPYWTLHTPNRVTGVKVNSDALVYFNNVGEIFINRQMQSGDRFEIKYNRPAHEAEQIQEILSTLGGTKDSGYNNALVLNRDLPSGIDQSVYELTYRIIQNAETPYEKACAIRDYLKTMGRYSLESDYPGENEDAVSFFVNEGLTGYCVHFASTMAVMARIAGLPARYAEGYLASIGEDGSCIVTGEQAHAWTEIYFNGYGWMTFDATPARAEDGEDNEDDSAQDDAGSDGTENEDQDGEETEDEDENADHSPTPTPEPTPEPTATPEPENEDDVSWNMGAEPTPTPTPNPNGGNRSENDSRTNEPDEQDNQEEEDRKDKRFGKILLILLLILLAIAAACLAVAFRLKNTDPEKMEKRVKTTEDRLMVWYRAMLTALSKAHVRYETGDTPALFAERALERKACTEDFVLFSAIVSKRRYSESDATSEEFRIAQNAYRGIVHAMNIPRRARWYVHRVTRGIGRLNQVP